ncbi:PIH1 family, partial [Dipodascopsis tothii]|uniref:PIH1 family n=1 Tax=Dipodascopsis tothii TaxID=44089 RepID=UPI0034CFFF73
PTPGFAVKTATEAASDVPAGAKVFVNVCHDKKIPEPDGTDDGFVADADGCGPDVLERVRAGGDWIIPIIVSERRTDTDKAGRQCYVYDCSANTKVLRAALQEGDIRLLLIETCFELIEERDQTTLSRGTIWPST